MVELQPLGRLGQRVRTISDTRDWRHTAFSCRSRDLHAPGEAQTRRGYSGLRGGGIGCRGASNDIQGAPFMLSLRHIGNEDLASLQQAFDGFRQWAGFRTVLQTLAFGANLWSLAVIEKHQ